jgi:16S rRNA (cytosine967-C5)-methyltransferase
VAHRVLQRVRRDGSWANLVLPRELDRAGLDGRDAALATELAYGTIRMRSALDFAIASVSSRPISRIEPQLLDLLQLGAYQILFTPTPDHASVFETVRMAQPRSAPFANGVLRRLAAGGIAWPDRQADLARHLEVRQSHPRWIVDLMIAERGPETAAAICEADNEPPPLDLRVNLARSSRERVRSSLAGAGVQAEDCRWSPRGLRLRSGGRPAALPGFADGWFAVQDESSMLVVDALDPRPGQLVVDLCAGPGGKSGAAGETARVVALDPVGARAGLVASAAGRLGSHVHAVQADGRLPPLRALADAVLVDAPCSGLGVLRRRADARWRCKPEDVARFAELQAQLVDAGWGLVRPGGRLVYSVCTLTGAETIGVLERLLARRDAELVPALPAVARASGVEAPWLQLLTHTHGTDGMFIATVGKK